MNILFGEFRLSAETRGPFVDHKIKNLKFSIFSFSKFSSDFNKMEMVAGAGFEPTAFGL